MSWQDRHGDKVRTADEAVKAVKSGDKVSFALSVKPRALCLALARRKDELRHTRLISTWTEDYPFLHPDYAESFDVIDVNPMRYTREGFRERRYDYAPNLFGLANGERQLGEMRGSLHPYSDVYMLKLTPPNSNGYLSFGHDIFYSRVAISTAKTVIAEIDSSLPWTYGDAVHVSELDYLVETPCDLERSPALPVLPPSDEVDKLAVIGANIAALVKDGDTIQIGVGAASEAVMEFLRLKSDLGIDTEVVYPPMIEMIKEGVFTGRRKSVNREKVLCTAVYGTYGAERTIANTLDFVDRNPTFEFRDSSWICNVPRIASNDNMVAINSLLRIDMVGQGVASHIGPTPVGGIGGHSEFTIGSHYSSGGRSINAMLSTAKGGKLSRIVPQLELGTVIATPCPYVDYLVTEHGAVNLECKTMRQRAEAIVSIADPQFQPELRSAAESLFYPKSYHLT